MSTEKRNPQAEQLANDVVKALEDETARLRKLTADFISDFVRRRIVAALTHQRNHVIVEKCNTRRMNIRIPRSLCTMSRRGWRSIGRR